MISKFSLAALSLLLHTMQELAVIQILKKKNWYFSPTIFAEVISPVRNHYFSRRNNNPVPKGDLRFWPLNVHGKPKKQKEERNMLFIWWWVAHASQPFFCPQVQGWWRFIYIQSSLPGHCSSIFRSCGIFFFNFWWFAMIWWQASIFPLWKNILKWLSNQRTT